MKIILKEYNVVPNMEERNELNYVDGIPVKFAYVKYLVKPLNLTA